MPRGEPWAGPAAEGILARVWSGELPIVEHPWGRCACGLVPPSSCVALFYRVNLPHFWFAGQYRDGLVGVGYPPHLRVKRRDASMPRPTRASRRTAGNAAPKRPASKSSASRGGGRSAASRKRAVAAAADAASSSSSSMSSDSEADEGAASPSEGAAGTRGGAGSSVSKGLSASASRLGSSEATSPMQRGYLEGASNRRDLVARLERTLETLKDLPQDFRSAELQATAKALAQDTLLRHSDKDVKYLTACCLCDILRIYAPDPPYSSNKLLDIFTLVTSRLEGLSEYGENDIYYDRAFYILESLASFSSHLVLADVDEEDLAENGDTAALQGGDAITALFTTLLDNITPPLPSRVEKMALDVMSSALDALRYVPTGLMATMLTPLLESSKLENERSHALASALIARTAERVGQHISDFISAAIQGDGSMAVDSTNSELTDREQLHYLVFELALINSDLLTTIMPAVCAELRVDDLAVRTQGTVLLTDLFASPDMDLAEKYKKAFDELLLRATDSDHNIRIKLVEFAGVLLQHKPALATYGVGVLLGRGQDPDARVRKAMVAAVCDAASARLSDCPANLLKAVGQRCLDKKVEIRKDAATGLAQIFAAYMPSLWKAVAADESAPRVPAMSSEMEEKLMWIPGHVVLGYTMPEVELQLRAIQLLDHILLYRNLDVATRARALLHMRAAMKKGASAALRKLLYDRASAQAALRKYLDERSIVRSGSQRSSFGDLGGAGGAGSARSTGLDEALRGLARWLPMSDATERLRAFDADHNDGHIFKHLATLCSHTATHREIKKARDDLLKRLGKTPAAELIKPLIRRTAMNTVHRDSVPHMLQLVLSAVEHEEFDYARSSMQLMQDLARFFPLMFEASLAEISELVQSGADGVSAPAMVMLSLVSTAVRSRNRKGAEGTSTSTVVTSGIKRTLLKSCKQGSCDEAKAAVISLVAAFRDKPDDSTLSALADELASEDILDIDYEHLTTALRSLATLALEDPESFSRVSDVCVNFATGWIAEDQELGTASSTAQRRSSSVSDDAERRILCIKLVTNHVRGLGRTSAADADVKSRANLVRTVRSVIDLLVSIIDTDGNPQGSPRTSEADKAAVRLAAGACMLRLARVPGFDSLVTPEQFQKVAWLTIDEDQSVCAGMRAKVARHLGRRLPTRYLAFLVLSQTVLDKAGRKEVRAMIVRAVNNMRSKLQQHKESVSAAGAASASAGLDGDRDTADALEGDSSASGPSPAEQARISLMAEYAVPAALHLIAHHPDFPTDLVGGGSDKQLSLRYLRQYVECLLDAVVTDSDGMTPGNTSFLLHMLRRMRQCDDTQSPGTRNVHIVGDMATTLLKRKVKKDSDLSQYSGKIWLPMSMFKVLESGPVFSVMESLLPADFGVAGRSPLKSPRKAGSPTKAASPSKRRRLSPSARTPVRSPARSPTSSSAKPSRKAPGRAAHKQTGTYADDASDAGDGAASDMSDAENTVRGTSVRPSRAGTKKAALKKKAVPKRAVKRRSSRGSVGLTSSRSPAGAAARAGRRTRGRL